MAILTLKDGLHYREVCPACGGIHIYDQKSRGMRAETERYLCADCGHTTVAPILELLAETASPAPIIQE